MDSDRSHHILLSPQENENDMYKLTYDSEENEEVIAPKSSSPGQKKPKSTGHDSKMKSDAENSNEKGSEEVLSPSQKKTKDIGTYSGNGRFYSLFANDNFLTEDPKKKKKSCCVGLKKAFFIATVVVLVVAILCLMWVIRGLQIEQEHINKRLNNLENSHWNGGSSSQNAAMKQPGGPGPVQVAGGSQCCSSNKEQIDYLNDVLRGQSKKFKHLEGKLRNHIGSTGIRDAEISRITSENTADIEAALSMVTSVKTALEKVEKLADSAKNVALFALKDANLSEDQLNSYLETLNSARASKAVAFSVVHAMGKDHVVARDPHSADEVASPPLPYYDVNRNFAPVISFTEEVVGGGENIQPESGAFRVPSTGNYVLLISFCVHSNRDTSVHLMRNGKTLREMEISTDSLKSGDPDDSDLNPPPEFDRPPLPVLKPPPPFAAPPLPGSDKATHIRPYHFSEVTKLEVGDTLYLKIHKGSIVEYVHLPGTNAAESCTRFAGFKL